MPNGGGIYENDATQVNRQAWDLIQKDKARSKIKKTSSLGSGFGGGAGDGLVALPPIVDGPDAEGPSPWYQASMSVLNNDTDSLEFGFADAVDGAWVYYYASRDSAIVETGFLHVWHDGAGNAFVNPVEDGDDAGIAFTATSLLFLTLTCTADNSGGDTTVRLLWAQEGVTSGAVIGQYKAVRGSRIEVGDWAVSHLAGAPYEFRTSFGDCGLTLAGSVAAGVLSITVNADSSDTDDTAIVLTYLTFGVNGTAEWGRSALAVADGGSASENFTSPNDGQIAWQTVVVEAAASVPETYIFGGGLGASNIKYYATRKSMMQVGEIRVWDDLAGGNEKHDVLIAAPTAAGVGMAVSGAMSGSQLAVTFTVDATAPEPVRIIMSFVTEVAIP